MYGIFILVAIAVLGILYLERKIINSAHDSLKPAELPQYQRWANAPLDLPPDALMLKPELPAPIANERDALFREVRRQFEHWMAVLGKGKPSAFEQMQNGRPLTPDQMDVLTSVTSTFPPLIVRAKALFDDPNYVANQRTYPPANPTQFMDFNMTLRALDTYARRHIYTGDTASAVETLDVMLSMNRHDPYSGYIYTVSAYDAGNRTARIASLITRSTSDTAHLQALLNMMNRQRDQLYGVDDTAVYLGDYFRVFRQIMADGYTTEAVVTRRMLVHYSINLEEDYLLWLDRQLPASSPRRVGVQRRLAEYRSRPRGKFDIESALNRAPLKFLFGRLKNASTEAFVVSHWIHSRDIQKGWASSRLNYDTARLTLGQRIAELNGDPIPQKPEDFVPRYLPTYPMDASTSAPVLPPMPGISENNNHATASVAATTSSRNL